MSSAGSVAASYNAPTEDVPSREKLFQIPWKTRGPLSSGRCATVKLGSRQAKSTARQMYEVCRIKKSEKGAWGKGYGEARAGLTHDFCKGY